MKKVHIKLGPKAIKNFGYSVEDVGSGKTTYHGSMAKTKALKKKMGSYERMNKERKSQGFKAKSDRASKGLYDFLDKFD